MARVQPVLTEAESAMLLSPKELQLLGRQLARAKDADEAARLRERLTRGFYGI